jgi:hypothetical protein
MTVSDSPGPSRGDGGHGKEQVAGAFYSFRRSRGDYAHFAVHAGCVDECVLCDCVCARDSPSVRVPQTRNVLCVFHSSGMASVIRVRNGCISVHASLHR